MDGALLPGDRRGPARLIAFGSLLFTPFTEQYARESVPRQFWSSPAFKQTNRRLTIMWAFAEVAAVCGIGLDEARERLGRVATEEHVGFDGLWHLNGTGN
jgi:hypothetical protein